MIYTCKYGLPPKQYFQYYIERAIECTKHLNKSLATHFIIDFTWKNMKAAQAGCQL